MADEKRKKDAPPENGGQASVAVKTRPSRKRKPKTRPPQPLPPWKVMLHNDDKNEMGFVVRTIVELTHLREQDAILRMIEAHETGVALLVTTHKERAELYRDQFQSKGLVVTIEPAAG